MPRGHGNLPGNHGAPVVIRIYADLETLSQAAAELFAQQAEAAIEARGRFSVALAGGKTPQKTYELLARSPLRDRIAWKHVHVFWGDERCVSIEDPRSNALMARTALLDRVPVPPAQIHPIQCAVSPEDAARRYELLLRSFLGPGPPGLDLILLGLGEDGHTASLFPHKPSASPPPSSVDWTAIQRGRIVLACRPRRSIKTQTDWCVLCLLVERSTIKCPSRRFPPGSPLAVNPFVLRYRSTRVRVRPSIPQGERLSGQNHFGYSFGWRCT
jgi:6-phosphogluconolactonase/glucosamine-6-phosphate isomerase/deaminase